MTTTRKTTKPAAAETAEAAPVETNEAPAPEVAALPSIEERVGIVMPEGHTVYPYIGSRIDANLHRTVPVAEEGDAE